MNSLSSNFTDFGLPHNLKHPSQQEKHKQVFITRKGREVKAKTTKPVAEPPPFWLKRTHQRNPQQEALHPKELLQLASPGRVPRSEERRGEACRPFSRLTGVPRAYPKRKDRSLREGTY
ncbi:hypothetical protein AALP_AA2G051900 [Arabis alpina]|uniref:Uncharacterized protein n=1 Tax=Arabis alpina TaxID=50452 RepID=A0A087HFG3_ARAAL|nr:hypothetical protein AALP_AA2G051900 [Arabis alpina]